MSAVIASDLNNPEFVGATDPDARLHVTFFVRPQQNEFKSNFEGRPIFEDVQMVRILIPGDQTSVIEQVVREDHKLRFPRHWAYFEQTQGKDNLQVGTPLSQWPLLGPAQVEMLKAVKFMTVEQVASASDDQIAKIGMGGGMAPFALREKAKRYLMVAKDAAHVDKAAEELKAFKEEAAKKEAAYAEQFAALQEQIAQLMSQAPEKKKPGRPAKLEVEQP